MSQTLTLSSQTDFASFAVLKKFMSSQVPPGEGILSKSFVDNLIHFYGVELAKDLFKSALMDAYQSGYRLSKLNYAIVVKGFLPNVAGLTALLQKLPYLWYVHFNERALGQGTSNPGTRYQAFCFVSSILGENLSRAAGSIPAYNTLEKCEVVYNALMDGTYCLPSIAM